MSLRGNKRCSKCGLMFTRAGRYCHACHAAYMRAWRLLVKHRYAEALQRDHRRAA